MRIIDLSQCKTDLDFKPIRSWPALLPIFAYKGQKLVGFEGQEDSPAQAGHRIALEYPEAISFADVLVTLYEKLSGAELLHLCALIQKLWPDQGLEQKVLQAFGFRVRDSLAKLLDWYTKLPTSYQTWLKSKDLGFNELEALRLIPIDSGPGRFVDHLLGWQPSRSDGFRALEMYGDLRGFGESPESLEALLHEPTLEATLNKLFSLRYPERHKRMQSMQKKSKQLPWPRNTQTRWDFQSDRPSLEVRLKVHSATELERASQQLSLASQKSQAQEGNPWA